MSKKNVILTGGAGFIGSHWVKLLIKNNYNVIVFHKSVSHALSFSTARSFLSIGFNRRCFHVPSYEEARKHLLSESKPFCRDPLLHYYCKSWDLKSESKVLCRVPSCCSTIVNFLRRKLWSSDSKLFCRGPNCCKLCSPGGQHQRELWAMMQEIDGRGGSL